jgi:hypothetical protein
LSLKFDVQLNCHHDECNFVCNLTYCGLCFIVEWIPIVLAYAQLNWKVTLNMDWNDCNNSDNSDRLAIVEKFWRAWELRLNELSSDVVACPGALELVQSLKAINIPMAIVTSSRFDSVKKKMLK